MKVENKFSHLISFSGGKDSSYLLKILCSRGLGYKILISHIKYPNVKLENVHFLTIQFLYCLNLHFKFCLQDINGSLILKNIRKRKRIFNTSLITKFNINYLLYGSQLNDYVENFFMRIIMESSFGGLTSFSRFLYYAKDGKLVKVFRPLSNISRRTIEKDLHNVIVQPYDFGFRCVVRSLTSQISISNLHKINNFCNSLNLLANNHFIFDKQIIFIKKHKIIEVKNLTWKLLNFYLSILEFSASQNFSVSALYENIIDSLKSKDLKLFHFGSCTILVLNKRVFFQLNRRSVRFEKFKGFWKILIGDFYCLYVYSDCLFYLEVISKVIKKDKSINHHNIDQICAKSYFYFLIKADYFCLNLFIEDIPLGKAITVGNNYFLFNEIKVLDYL